MREYMLIDDFLRFFQNPYQSIYRWLKQRKHVFTVQRRDFEKNAFLFYACHRRDTLWYVLSDPSKPRSSTIARYPWQATTNDISDDALRADPFCRTFNESNLTGAGGSAEATNNSAPIFLFSKLLLAPF